MSHDDDKAPLVVRKGDQYLAGLLTLIAIPCLVACWFMLHEEVATTLPGKSVKWILLELFSIMIVFCVLALLRSFGRPRWLERALATTGRRLMLFYGGLFLISVLASLVFTLVSYFRDSYH